MNALVADLRPAISRRLVRALRSIDALFLRVYGQALNPLYQSGTLAVASLLVALVTGVYLLVFYRVSAPYASIATLQGDLWIGRWVRAVHRYASDVCVLAVIAHVLKMIMGGRTWGPRMLAWLSGVALTMAVMFTGLTGLVMVWDAQAQVLAVDAVKLLDLLPILSEPLGRLFAIDRALPGSFFFMTLFLHVLTPLGGAALLWIHLSRLARPALLPPPGITKGLVASLVVISVVFPAPLLPAADMQAIPGPMPIDLPFGFWIVLSRALGPLPTLGMVALGLVAVCLVPWAVKPTRRPAPSHVDTRSCTGCTTCSLDCPYDAIRMVPRQDRREKESEMMALVNPSLCVSCGICAASCAPMGVGPGGRTGRDLMRHTEGFLHERPLLPTDVVVLTCRNGPGECGFTRDGIVIIPTECSGTVHTSQVELLLRRGAAGVCVLSCPPRDCASREGPKWLEQRMFLGREAELQERVDRRRVRVLSFSAAQGDEIVSALAAFQTEVVALARAAAEAAAQSELDAGDKRELGAADEGEPTLAECHEKAS